MSSIALFPCSFTSGEQVVAELSQKLKLQIYTDQDLIKDTAARYGADLEKLHKMLFGTTSVFNCFTLERELCVNMFRSVLAANLLRSVPTLFYGLHSLLVSDRVTHVLKVLVVDTRQARIAEATRQNISTTEAKKTVHADDVIAYAWTDFLFKKEAYDKSLYDLVIPVKGRSVEPLVDEIKNSFRNTAVLHTAESQQAVADMELATRVERVLLDKGHKLQVVAEGGKITLVTNENVLSFARLSKELGSIAGQVRGVSEVQVLKNPEYTDSIYRRQRFELPSKVLFVDDEKEFVRTVSERLISRDVGTYGVFSGEKALELVAGDRPDVMVLDLKMPGMHGVEVLRHTKQIAPEVEVIILTGHGTSKDMQECMELGAFAYMNKPVDIEELSATIKAANEKAHLKVA